MGTSCEPFSDNERARVARCWRRRSAGNRENCLPGVGGGSAGGSGSCGGESSRVNTHNAVTSTATRPALYSLLVPATDIFPSGVCLVLPRDRESARAWPPLDFRSPRQPRNASKPIHVPPTICNSIPRGFLSLREGIPPRERSKFARQDQRTKLP